MDVDFRATQEFPVDDSGNGFDNIADVLTISPVLKPFNNQLYFPSVSLVFVLLIIYCFKSEGPLYKEAT